MKLYISLGGWSHGFFFNPACPLNNKSQMVSVILSPAQQYANSHKSQMVSVAYSEAHEYTDDGDSTKASSRAADDEANPPAAPAPNARWVKDMDTKESVASVCFVFGASLPFWFSLIVFTGNPSTAHFAMLQTKSEKFWVGLWSMKSPYSMYPGLTNTHPLCRSMS